MYGRGGTINTTTTTKMTTATMVIETEETSATAVVNISTLRSKVGRDERGDVVRVREGVMFSYDADGYCDNGPDVVGLDENILAGSQRMVTSVGLLGRGGGGLTDT